MKVKNGYLELDVNEIKAEFETLREWKKEIDKLANEGYEHYKYLSNDVSIALNNRKKILDVPDGHDIVPLDKKEINGVEIVKSVNVRNRNGEILATIVLDLFDEETDN